MCLGDPPLGLYGGGDEPLQHRPFRLHGLNTSVPGRKRDVPRPALLKGALGDSTGNKRGHLRLPVPRGMKGSVWRHMGAPWEALLQIAKRMTGSEDAFFLHRSQNKALPEPTLHLTLQDRPGPGKLGCTLPGSSPARDESS